MLPDNDERAWAGHPKIAATVRRVTELWALEEKVLVFCFYIHTGRALRSHISGAIRDRLLEIAAGKLGCSPADAERISSAVMAEGVDLHRSCRHVIHHDLDWNPSTIEQRTGRVDRLGSKAERSHKPVVVNEPYMAGTQDEKQFRVMKDRERWFNVVMGERLQLDEAATDRLPIVPTSRSRAPAHLRSIWRSIGRQRNDAVVPAGR